MTQNINPEATTRRWTTSRSGWKTKMAPNVEDLQAALETLMKSHFTLLTEIRDELRKITGLLSESVHI
jgi:hypothetical protein